MFEDTDLDKSLVSSAMSGITEMKVIDNIFEVRNTVLHHTEKDTPTHSEISSECDNAKKVMG